MTSTPHPTAQVLGFVVAALCQVLGAHCEKHRGTVPIVRILWGRLHRTAARFELLFTRWYEGRPLAPRNPVSRNPRAPRNPLPCPDPEPGAIDPEPVLPRKPAWLAKLVPQTEIFGRQLHYLLADPDVANFLAEVPQAGRMLRPLCRMLGVEPLPQMLPPKRPKPDPPAPEQEMEKPPPRPPSEAQIARQARKRWFTDNIAPGPRPMTAGEDQRHMRPVSLWCRATRSRP